MDLRGIWFVSLALNILYLLLATYFFMAASFFGGSTFFKLIKELPLIYTLPQLLSVITFILFLYQSHIDTKQGLMMASSRTQIYFVLNIVFILFSTYRIIRG